MDEGRVTDMGEQREPDRLSVGRSTVDGVTVVTVNGEVDHHTSAVLREALVPEDPDAATRTVADFSGAAFMDSSGINVLIAARRAHDPAGRLRLAGVRRPVLRTLEIVGLSSLLPCYPSVRDALSA
ncbi:STAS domain-containing protein [Streptomyces sp. NPDC006193]|uniref:STAS domain-containing protein n=1 Tax=Streptomyces sp. NPDC006193 TaxID=3155717 RepID=UPI0033B9C2DE